MGALLIWISLAAAGVWGISGIAVLGLMPRWIRNAQDGDLAELGIASGPAR